MPDLDQERGVPGAAPGRSAAPKADIRGRPVYYICRRHWNEQAMKLLGSDAAKSWCGEHSIPLSDIGYPETHGPDLTAAQYSVPAEAARHFWFSQLIERQLRPWSRCLVWVSEWGIWPSSENWHLYYRLRPKSLAKCLIEDAPAHLMLSHEASDLISLVQLVLSFGWNAHILTAEDYARVFISHNEWIEFAFKDAAAAGELQSELKDAGITKRSKGK